MDRVTNYFGALVRETDLLQAEQDAMAGLAWLTQSTLGPAPGGGGVPTTLPSFVTAVDGFSCVPTAPASLNVILNPGVVYALQALEATVWSSLGINSAQQIPKQGIMALPDTLTITPPGTTGFSQVYLIEVQYADLDTNPVLLPYYNAANPTVPFSGPQNSGQSQNTARLGIASVQIKAGTPATTGTQVAPSVDAGWTGLFNITVANGQTSITSGNIQTILTAPWIPAKLPTVPAAVVNGSWTYCVDTGTANTYVSAVWPIPTALVAGMQVRLKIANANTGASTFNLNGLGAAPILRGNLGALAANDLTVNSIVDLTYDGANWQIANYIGLGSGSITQNFTTGLPYAVDTGTASALVGPFSPAITGGQYVGGLGVLLSVAHDCPGGTVTFQPNALTAHNVLNFDGTQLNSKDWTAGEVLWLIYDGTNWRLQNARNPNGPLKILEASGVGQTFGQNVIQTVTCFTSVTRNTLLTSTWNGTTFTVGAGEEGLWSFYAFAEITASAGSGGSSYFNIGFTRTRSAVTQYYWPNATGFANASAAQPAFQLILDLQVGDTVQIFFQAGAVSSQVVTQVAGGGYSNFVATRLLGAH